MGVRNAVLRLVKDLNDTKTPSSVYGNLIHNPQTIEVLKERGIETINSLKNILGKKIAIRTHGVPIDETRYIKKHSSALLNLTCPRVAKVQSLIKQYSRKGYYVLICGDKDHAEVLGLISFAENGCSVVTGPDEIINIPENRNILLVSQTTFDGQLFISISERAKELFPGLEIINTICDSTRLRQNDLIEASAKNVNTLVVIGGRNSANTRRLYEIGKSLNMKAFLVEEASELCESDFTRDDVVLVTAGASTPGWIIRDILERLYEIKSFKKCRIFRIFRTITKNLFELNIVSAFFASAMTFFSQTYSNTPTNPYLVAVSFIYILSMYSINNYFDSFSVRSFPASRNARNGLTGAALFAISIILSIAGIFPAYSAGIDIMFIYLLLLTTGFIYFSPALSRTAARKLHPILRKFYNSKQIACMGWAAVTVLFPFLYSGGGAISFLPLFLIIPAVSVRHLLSDISDYQSDIIFGRESLPTWLGLHRTSILIKTILTASFLIYTTGTAIYSEPIYLIPSAGLLYQLYLLNDFMKNLSRVRIDSLIRIDLSYLIFILLFAVTLVLKLLL